MFHRRSSNPCFILAKFASKCPETGLIIKAGERCAYFPRDRKAYHDTSKSAEQLRALDFAQAYNMADANW